MVGLAPLDPIRINLSDGVFQKFWIIQELETTRVFSAVVDACRFSKESALAVKRLVEFGLVVDHGDQLTDPISQADGGTPEASSAVGPNCHQQDAMLDDYGHEFQIHFRQLLSGRGPDVVIGQTVIRLPEFEKAFDLPSRAVKHHDFLPRQQ
jgi:hypothetical protein